MIVVVDTNVGVVANNRQSAQASSGCILACIRALREIEQKGIVAIDDGWRIISEYRQNLNQSGQPGVGDQFLKWVLRNLTNPNRCVQVRITNRPDSTDITDFVEFPEDAELADFDRSDRKFVAVAMAHPEHPPILNAVDSDWWIHNDALARHEVAVKFLCLDAVQQRRLKNSVT